MTVTLLPPNDGSFAFVAPTMHRVPILFFPFILGLLDLVVGSWASIFSTAKWADDT